MSPRITEKARRLVAERALAMSAGSGERDGDTPAEAAVEAALAAVRRRNQSLRAAGRNPRARIDQGDADPAPTPEQRARDSYAEVETLTHDVHGNPVRAVAKRNLTASPLDRYLKRGRIERGAWEAGERLRRQWRASGLERNMTTNYEGVRIDGGDPAWQMPASERQAHARQAVRAALRNVGKLAAGVLVDLIVHELTARDIGHRAGRRGKYAEVAGMERIQMALAALAHCYGISIGEGPTKDR